MKIEFWISDKVPKDCIDKEFIQYMINRLIVGHYRYEKDTPRTQRNYFKRIVSTGQKYIKTRNREFLIDLANYAMREFRYPHMPNTFFEVSDSDGRRKKD